MKRMWIDQPSILQPYHALHGTNVLAWPPKNKRIVCRIYFLNGPVISAEILTSSLSDGWR